MRVRLFKHMPKQQKPNNLRTALILALIALGFFIGLFVKRLWFQQ